MRVAVFIVALLWASLGRADPSPELIRAAQAEGRLTLYGVTLDWCGYGRAIEAFAARYAIEVADLSPNANSGEIIEAIRANQENAGPQSPDASDVGLAAAVKASAAGLLQAYRVEAWAAIPAAMKDAAGTWTGTSYGVLAFEVNADLVHEPPADWADLLSPRYRNMVALTGNPRTSNLSLQAVYAAGLSATGGAAAGAAEAGLAFFARLKASGNFVPAGGNAGSLAQGVTPIVIRWDYLALADRDTLKGNPAIAVVIPRTGVVAGLQAAIIAKHAPHPNAARLWLEYLYSDEGHANYAAHHCHTTRDKPANDGAIWPSLAELAAARDVIAKGW